ITIYTKLPSITIENSTHLKMPRISVSRLLTITASTLTLRLPPSDSTIPAHAQPIAPLPHTSFSSGRAATLT
ncbi:MAG: hypothetical protein ACKO96_18480, partial [Flammeovirgaceae bacterium]